MQLSILVFFVNSLAEGSKSEHQQTGIAEHQQTQKLYSSLSNLTSQHFPTDNLIPYILWFLTYVQMFNVVRVVNFISVKSRDAAVAASKN